MPRNHSKLNPRRARRDFSSAPAAAPPAPCPRCLALAQHGRIRVETVMPLSPAGPTSKEHPFGPICHDCNAAETIVRLGMVPTFTMARIAVGNDRQEQFRLPGAPMGLVQAGLVRPSAAGDFERHLAWQEQLNHFGLEEEDR